MGQGFQPAKQAYGIRPARPPLSEERSAQLGEKEKEEGRNGLIYCSVACLPQVPLWFDATTALLVQQVPCREEKGRMARKRLSTEVLLLSYDAII